MCAHTNTQVWILIVLLKCYLILIIVTINLVCGVLDVIVNFVYLKNSNI